MLYIKKLPLVYWAVRENYGDLLSPFIMHHLTGLPIRRVDVAYMQKSCKHLITSFLYGKIHSLQYRFWPFQKNYVCIGSILGQGNKYSHYWGSGCLYKLNAPISGIVHAVRGYKSKEEILRTKSKFVGNIAVGDPALLLPMFIPPTTRTHQLGIIPHYQDYSFFVRHYGEKFFIINVESSDVVKVTQQITSCKYILSTSLHGLIVAHAYNIPALWIETKELQPGSGGFKFYDYFSSVGLDYMPIKNIEYLLQDNSNIEKLFSNNMNTLPKKDLSIIRTNLLKSAPFPIKREFYNYNSYINEKK